MENQKENLGIGESLLEAKHRSGKKIQDISNATKVTVRLLEALEKEDFDALGGAVYVKLFLRAYGQEVGISGDDLYKKYKAAYVNPLIEVEKKKKEEERRGKQSRLITIAGSFLFVLAIVGLYVTVVRSIPEKKLGPEGFLVDLPQQPLVLNVRAFEPTYIEVRVDGGEVSRTTLQSGEVRSWIARDTVLLKVGNALGLEVEVNGKIHPLFGARGQVVTTTFTRQSQAS